MNHEQAEQLLRYLRSIDVSLGLSFFMLLAIVLACLVIAVKLP